MVKKIHIYLFIFITVVYYKLYTRRLIKAFSPKRSCWSYVGRKGSEQALSLSTPECINKGTIIHEFLHALGLWHEHSRSDRDEYIEILWNNVVNEGRNNTLKVIYCG